MMEDNFENEVRGRTKKSSGDTKIKKFITIIGTALLLLIPLAFMYGIIGDRTNYREEAVKNVSQSWAESQQIGLPTLSFTTINTKKEEITNYLKLNNYQTDITIKTETRKKGIFKVPVYIAEVVQKGDFTNNYGNLTNKKLALKIKVSDARGFVSEPNYKINGENPHPSQDTTYYTTLKNDTKIIPFEISYKIKGLNYIYVALGGASNKISIKGNWKDPSFEGDYLPTEREVTNKDFSATWSVPKIALKGDDLYTSSVSVSLLIPVDNYSMTERSLKYGFLLLTLTFMGYFIYEITSKEKKKIHPIQYCLLGAAILIFYMLLVSISELISFNISYIIAAVMVMSMIFTYTYFVITKKAGLSFSIGITSLIGLLYAYFYALLRLQDIALLAGSLGLFMIIAVIMYLTRDVKWYNED